MNTNKAKLNLYEAFIEILKTLEAKGFDDDALVHVHHIQPKHDGGDPKGPSVICTIRNHARAHYIRYKVYGQTYDLCAYYGLVKKTDESQKLIQQQIVETNRQRGNTFFSQEWQQEMASRSKSSYYLRENPDFAREIARKGGLIGGQIMTPAKLAAMKQNGYNVGTNYGRMGGLKKQDSVTKTRLALFLEWEHDSGIMAISPPMESVRELKEYLNLFVPNSARHSSGISAILRGVEPKRYGWRVVRELEI